MAHLDPSSLCQRLFSCAELKSVINKLIKDVSDEINSNSSPFPKDYLQQLEVTVSSIGDALPDVEQLAISSEVEELVPDLKEVAYDIEDLLGEAASQRLEKTVPVSGIIDLLPAINPQQPRCGFASDLKLLLVGLDEIAAKLPYSSRIKNKPEYPIPTSFPKSRAEIETFCHGQQRLDSDKIVLGREEEKERLIHCILSPSTSLQHPIIVNVTGPGGIGKTTLVRQVCEDSRVSSSFDFISWVSYNGSLSYENGLTRLTGEIQRSAKGQRSVKRQGISFGPLEDGLCSVLLGRKFLLVVDDVKHELLSGWKEYLSLLMVGAKGSAVILISWSSIEIRRYMIAFGLDGIPEREGWSLFKRYAAFDEDAEQSEYSSLKGIGRSIVNKCGGSPLAVKTLASLLRNNKDSHYWEQIHQSKLWGQCDKAWTAWCISLQRVPVELIPSYVVFPKARNKSESTDALVWFWMAQGLLQSTKEGDDLRDIGHRFCNELESMSFLPSNPSRGYACLLECDFAQCLSGGQIGHVNGHLLPPTRTNLMWTEEMLSPYKSPKVSSTTPCKARTLRFTTIGFDHQHPEFVSKPFLEGLISNLKHLRVLFLDTSWLVELPKSIGKLKLLKYISLCRNHGLQVLTESICKLVNLQTLDLSGCSSLKALPRNMHKLVSMRHLLLSGMFSSLPDKALKSWTSLHHLKIYFCLNLTSLGKGIQNLTLLRTLQIEDCPSIASLPNSINCLTGLKELRIHNCANLDLTGWKGFIDLRSLKSLCIVSLPKLLELPDGLQSVADSLRYLVISRCGNLRTLPDSLECCTCLVDIIIQMCPNLLALPQGFHALKNLQVLKILGCPNLVKRCERAAGDDWHLISHIPIIYLDDEVIRNIDTLTAQEQPGAHDLFPPSKEIRPASATSPSEIIPATEDHSSASYLSDYDYPPSLIQHYSIPSTSEHHLSSPPSEGAVEHSHLARVKHSHPISVQPEVIHVAHSPDMDATGLENQGSSSNEDLFGTQVLELDKEMEGKRILLLFGDGYEFEKEMLIQLWMALGLLTNEPMEVIGARFFKKLVSEGYILCSAANYLYKVNTGKLNTELDMVTDKQNYLILDNRSRNDAASTETLHVSVVCDDIDKAAFKTLGRFNRLRTLLFLGNYGSRLQQVPRDLFLCYGSLLALDLSGTHIKELPSSVNKMIHLRYLDLSWTFIKLLPESIDRFKKLQTLKLKGCSHLNRLPKEIKGLAELRHLDLDVLGQLAAFPQGMGALVNLRTLSAFPIGTEEGLKITELKHLNNLTGEFCIANLENVRSADEAKEALLTAKRSITMLELRWSDYQLQAPKDEDESILKNLLPHSNLEEIQILCYPGTTFPGWIADTSFHKLDSITLFRCEHVSMLPFLGKLPSLKTLKLVGLNNVTKMDFRGELNNVAFPVLQKLAVDEMCNLEAWADAQEGDYPCLTELRIKDCPKLPELPYLIYLTSLKQLELSGCDKLAFVSEEKLSCSLQQLIVEDCPSIKERCSEKGGQDWHKIYHVPNIWIDQEACETYQEDSDVSEEYDDE